jgi:hypothetical protein
MRTSRKETPRLSFWPLQHCGSGRPSFHSPGLRERPEHVAVRPGSSTLRVWLPSRWFPRLPRPPRASFSSRHSWGPPFRAFLLPDDRRKSFPFPLPLLPFPAKPSRPGIGAPAVASHRRSRAPFCFPGGLDQGGARCSLGRYGLSGSPSTKTRLEASLFKPPLSLFR